MIVQIKLSQQQAALIYSKLLVAAGEYRTNCLGCARNCCVNGTLPKPEGATHLESG